MNIFRQAAAIALAAIGMTMIILTGGIDLSVGAVIALSGATGALAMQYLQNIGFNIILTGLIGIIVTIITAVGFGGISGLAVGYFKMPPFIVTLATMSLARGLTLTITKSSRIVVSNNLYNFISQTDIGGMVPASMVLVILAYIVAHFILGRTVFGRKTYSVGDNSYASRASGINVERQILFVYMLAGVFVALSTIVIVGRARSAQPLAGLTMEFDVITAVVLGGTSLLGGQGNLKGTFLGVILTSIIFTGLSMLDISPFVNYLVKGSLILLAVVSNRVVFSNVFAHGKKSEAHSIGRKHKDKNVQEEVHQLLKNNEQQVLSLKNISKFFPGVRALDNVSIDIKRGTIHALCGENGAGKSTLIKILAGVYTKDEGEILINGIPVQINSPIDAQNIGISVIYQELSNIPELNISQNVNLGREIPARNKIFVDTKKMEEKTKQLLSRFGLNLNANKSIDSYSVGQQQMVEIAKAVGSNAWIIVMDEPTSAITEADKERLFEVIRELKENNIAVVYISHRMSEVFEIADEITILRDGKHIISGPIENFDEKSVIKYMVGREIDDIFTREKNNRPGEEVLRVENLYRKGVFEPISFTVRSGEVVGFCGLMGAGRTEIMRCIFGLDKADGGEIYLRGKKLNIKCPMDAINAGISYISEDRRREGIVPHLSVRENTTLAALSLISSYGWIDKRKDLDYTESYINFLNIKTPSTEQYVMNLSGGNQQKVCLARWLIRKPEVIIMDEPTRGIDVGAKAEIHKLIDQMTKEGIAVILISSELPEIIGASNRIIVLYEGKKVKEYAVDDTLTQEELMKHAAGL